MSEQLLESGLSASSLAYLCLFEASAALVNQPVAALHALMHFTSRAGGCAKWG